MNPRLFVLNVLVATFSLLISGSRSDEPAKAGADPMLGTKLGQVRDDNGLRIKLVWCPPGKFTMGILPESEEERREWQVEATLTKGFWLGKYEVTQSEWKQVMKTEPWNGDLVTKDGADFPVTCVGWNDANDFCRKLTEQEREAGRLSNDWQYTLPTEAQWEWACRARSNTKFNFGDDESKLGDYAWFSGNTSDAGEPYAHRVGQKRANQWGLYDMHGNVSEWCRDIYTAKGPGIDVHVIPDENTRRPNRVVRGGSWFDVATYCRSGDRYGNPPDARPFFQGFRPALSAVR